MAALMLTIEPDELLGLSALVELDGAPDDGDTAAAVTKAKTLLRTALSDKLEAAGLPWAPTAAAVTERAAEVAGSASTLASLMANDKVRKYGGSIVAVAFLVALVGGYGAGWQWTGFQQNNQLWDWLHLLLLPVVLGTLPLWIQAREHISRTRRLSYAVFIVAWTGFVIAGRSGPAQLDRLSRQHAVGLVRSAAAAGRADRHATLAVEGAPPAALPKAHRRCRVRRVDHHRDRRLRAAMDLDWLRRQHLVGLAPATARAARVPHYPDSGADHMGLGRRGRARQAGSREGHGLDGHGRGPDLAVRQ